MKIRLIFFIALVFACLFRKRNELAELKAQENIIISRGITDEILKQQAIDKWNGVLPTTVAGNTGSIMNIPLK